MKSVVRKQERLCVRETLREGDCVCVSRRDSEREKKRLRGGTVTGEAASIYVTVLASCDHATVVPGICKLEQSATRLQDRRRTQVSEQQWSVEFAKQRAAD